MKDSEPNIHIKIIDFNLLLQVPIVFVLFCFSLMIRKEAWMINSD